MQQSRNLGASLEESMCKHVAKLLMVGAEMFGDHFGLNALGCKNNKMMAKVSLKINWHKPAGSFMVMKPNPLKYIIIIKGMKSRKWWNQKEFC